MTPHMPYLLYGLWSQQDSARALYCHGVLSGKEGLQWGRPAPLLPLPDVERDLMRCGRLVWTWGEEVSGGGFKV